MSGSSEKVDEPLWVDGLGVFKRFDWGLSVQPRLYEWGAERLVMTAVTALGGTGGARDGDVWCGGTPPTSPPRLGQRGGQAHDKISRLAVSPQ